MSKQNTGTQTEMGGTGDTKSNKSGKGAGTRDGGVSGGKATGGTTRKSKGESGGKGSGNR
jgi:hypothetical protein